MNRETRKDGVTVEVQRLRSMRRYEERAYVDPMYEEYQGVALQGLALAYAPEQTGRYMQWSAEKKVRHLEHLYEKAKRPDTDATMMLEITTEYESVLYYDVARIAVSSTRRLLKDHYVTDEWIHNIVTDALNNWYRRYLYHNAKKCWVMKSYGQFLGKLKERVVHKVEQYARELWRGEEYGENNIEHAEPRIDDHGLVMGPEEAWMASEEAEDRKSFLRLFESAVGPKTFRIYNAKHAEGKTYQQIANEEDFRSKNSVNHHLRRAERILGELRDRRDRRCLSHE